MEDSQVIALSYKCLQQNVKSYKSHLDCIALQTQNAEQACWKPVRVPKSFQKLGVEWAVLYTSFQIMEIYNFWEVYSLNKNVS